MRAHTEKVVVDLSDLLARPESTRTVLRVNRMIANSRRISIASPG